MVHGSIDNISGTRLHKGRMPNSQLRWPVIETDNCSFVIPTLLSSNQLNTWLQTAVNIFEQTHLVQ